MNKYNKEKSIVDPKKGVINRGLKSLGRAYDKFYSRQRAAAKEKSKLTLIGEQKLDRTEIQWYFFDEEELQIQHDFDSFKMLEHLPTSKIGWLNIHGLHDVKLIEKIAATLHIERITVRQLLDTTLRPKVEEFDHYLFFSIKSILHNNGDGLAIEHISFILNKNIVASFQEEQGDHFEHIREKIKEGIGFIRKKESEYLLAQLLDAILDNYFETIDDLNTQISKLENEVLNKPTQQTLVQLETARKQNQLVRKSLAPMMEALNGMLNEKFRFIAQHNLKFFRDLQNSCASALEEVEIASKTLESLTNIYFSSISNRLNETMKVLTTVATIFIPLTFIVGIYGMNFQYMPELTYRYGYFMVWGAMIAIVAGMVAYFRKKDWI